MKRLFYLTDSMALASQVSRQLQHTPGIANWRFHALAKDEAGLYSHQLQGASPLQRCDILRGTERGGLLGLMIGAAFVLLASRVIDFSGSWGVFAMVALIVSATLFGAWEGGMLGLSRENYKIRRFHNALEAGAILLMVDVRKVDEGRIRNLLSHIPIRPMGEGSSVVNPFAYVSA